MVLYLPLKLLCRKATFSSIRDLTKFKCVNTYTPTYVCMSMPHKSARLVLVVKVKVKVKITQIQSILPKSHRIKKNSDQVTQVCLWLSVLNFSKWLSAQAPKNERQKIHLNTSNNQNYLLFYEFIWFAVFIISFSTNCWQKDAPLYRNIPRWMRKEIFLIIVVI